MVGAGHPASVFPVHAGLADEDIVQSVVEHMAHVENTGHIRRRDNDGIRLLLVRLGTETLVFQPPGIPFVLNLRRIVFRGQLLILAHIFLLFNIYFVPESQI